MNDEYIDKEEMNLQENSLVSGMYKDWFLDYASYVILERAIPLINDGLKPVQRRILHSLKELDDGRYHKVANLIGNTMKYHPHGDASIGDALVKLGQKNLLIDPQGNWGNVFTGDRAAAARYIEARLTNFALDVCFSPKVTDWESSYDGRGKEPVSLPMKFPILLFHGAEGIAVGLSTKILPHNFNEIIDASINFLRGRNKKIKPDFPSGGLADFSNYNDGQKGGKIRVRAKIDRGEGKNNLKITELPYAVTTTSLIDSIIKANDKGKIKIKHIENNTAENVDITIILPNDVSIDKTIDALYAFTDCEITIHPSACVIENDKPIFTSISNILRVSAENTKSILTKELSIQLGELKEKWHLCSLERIFIENRIYRDIEEVDNWDDIIKTIFKGLKPYAQKLYRDITDDDVIKLTEIKIKRISKYDLEKEKEKVKQIENSIQNTEKNLNNIIDYTIDYLKDLKKKYGGERKRKTEEKLFDNIVASKVAIANRRLYVNRQEGFIGTSLRKEEFLFECSDIDDIIVFREDGKMSVTKVSAKQFIGKNIIHVGLFKKNDLRTIYNMLYRDGGTGKSYIKRFPVKGITRDKDYQLTTTNSIVLYFSHNPNGEAEIISIILRAKAKLKKLKFDLDFSLFQIKGRGVRGNLVTKHFVRKVELKEKGISTLGAKKIFLDSSINRLNDEGRGRLLGEFSADERILVVSKSGYIKLLTYDLSNHFPDDLLIIEKFDPKKIMNCIYYNLDNKTYYLKRFKLEINNKENYFLPDKKNIQLKSFFLNNESVKLVFKDSKTGKKRDDIVINPEKFISVKGIQALGKQLSNKSIKEFSLINNETNYDNKGEEIDLNKNDDQDSNNNKQITMKFD